MFLLFLTKLLEMKQVCSLGARAADLVERKLGMRPTKTVPHLCCADKSSAAVETESLRVGRCQSEQEGCNSLEGTTSLGNRPISSHNKDMPLGF